MEPSSDQKQLELSDIDGSFNASALTWKQEGGDSGICSTDPVVSNGPDADQSQDLELESKLDQSSSANQTVSSSMADRASQAAGDVENAPRSPRKLLFDEKITSIMNKPFYKRASPRFGVFPVTPKKLTANTGATGEGSGHVPGAGNVHKLTGRFDSIPVRDETPPHGLKNALSADDILDEKESMTSRGGSPQPDRGRPWSRNVAYRAGSVDSLSRNKAPSIQPISLRHVERKWERSTSPVKSPRGAHVVAPDMELARDDIILIENPPEPPAVEKETEKEDEDETANVNGSHPPDELPRLNTVSMVRSLFEARKAPSHVLPETSDVSALDKESEIRISSDDSGNAATNTPSAAVEVLPSEDTASQSAASAKLEPPPTADAVLPSSNTQYSFPLSSHENDVQFSEKFEESRQTESQEEVKTAGSYDTATDSDAPPPLPSTPPPDIPPPLPSTPPPVLPPSPHVRVMDIDWDAPEEVKPSVSDGESTREPSPPPSTQPPVLSTAAPIPSDVKTDDSEATGNVKPSLVLGLSSAGVGPVAFPRRPAGAKSVPAALAPRPKPSVPALAPRAKRTVPALAPRPKPSLTETNALNTGAAVHSCSPSSPKSSERKPVSVFKEKMDEDKNENRYLIYTKKNTGSKPNKATYTVNSGEVKADHSSKLTENITEEVTQLSSEVQEANRINQTHSESNTANIMGQTPDPEPPPDSPANQNLWTGVLKSSSPRIEEAYQKAVTLKPVDTTAVAPRAVFSKKEEAVTYRTESRESTVKEMEKEDAKTEEEKADDSGTTTDSNKPVKGIPSIIANRLKQNTQDRNEDTVQSRPPGELFGVRLGKVRRGPGASPEINGNEPLYRRLTPVSQKTEKDSEPEIQNQFIGVLKKKDRSRSTGVSKIFDSSQLQKKRKDKNKAQSASTGPGRAVQPVAKPCTVEFTGANVSTGRSLLQKKRKEKASKIFLDNQEIMICLRKCYILWRESECKIHANNISQNLTVFSSTSSSATAMMGCMKSLR